MHGSRDSRGVDFRDGPGSDGIPREERARRNGSALLRGARAVGLNALAEACGVSDSTVSRRLEKPEVLGMLVAATGNKVVPINKRCYDPVEIDALLTLVRKQTARMRSADDLDWDEEGE